MKPETIISILRIVFSCFAVLPCAVIAGLAAMADPYGTTSGVTLVFLVVFGILYGISYFIGQGVSMLVRRAFR